MNSEKVYSDNFILDCANLLKVEKNESLQLIRNKLKSNELQLGIFDFDRFLDTIRPLKYGNEIEKNFHDKILAWAGDSKIKAFNFPCLDLPKKSKPIPSSLWLETEEYENEL